MTRTMLKSKIHRATVTEANIEYEGSVTIDRDLMAGGERDFWEACGCGGLLLFKFLCLEELPWFC